MIQVDSVAVTSETG